MKTEEEKIILGSMKKLLEILEQDERDEEKEIEEVKQNGSDTKEKHNKSSN